MAIGMMELLGLLSEAKTPNPKDPWERFGGGPGLPPPSGGLGGGRPALPPQPWKRDDYLEFPGGWAPPEHAGMWGPEKSYDRAGRAFNKGDTPLGPGDWTEIPGFLEQFQAQPDVELWNDVLALLQYLMGRGPASFPEVSPRSPSHPSMRN